MIFYPKPDGFTDENANIESAYFISGKDGNLTVVDKTDVEKETAVFHVYTDSEPGWTLIGSEDAIYVPVMNPFMSDIMFLVSEDGLCQVDMAIIEREGNVAGRWAFNENHSLYRMFKVAYDGIYLLWNDPWIAFLPE